VQNRRFVSTNQGINRLSPSLSALRVPCVMNPQLHGECFRVSTRLRWHVTCTESEYKSTGHSQETEAEKQWATCPNQECPFPYCDSVMRLV